MNITPISSGSPITRLQGSTAVTESSGLQDVSQPQEDTVEISDTATYLSEIKKLPEIRQDKVDAAQYGDRQRDVRNAAEAGHHGERPIERSRQRMIDPVPSGYPRPA